jgi:hypothetical protein
LNIQVHVSVLTDEQVDEAAEVVRGLTVSG